MRTTVTLDDDTVQLLDRRRRERNISFNQALNEAVRAGLRAPSAAPFRTGSVSLGVATIDLDRALPLVGELDENDRLRRLRIGS